MSQKTMAKMTTGMDMVVDTIVETVETAETVEIAVATVGEGGTAVTMTHTMITLMMTTIGADDPHADTAMMIDVDTPMITLTIPTVMMESKVSTCVEWWSWMDVVKQLDLFIMIANHL